MLVTLMHRAREKNQASCATEESTTASVSASASTSSTTIASPLPTQTTRFANRSCKQKQKWRCGGRRKHAHTRTRICARVMRVDNEPHTTSATRQSIGRRTFGTNCLGEWAAQCTVGHAARIGFRCIGNLHTTQNTWAQTNTDANATMSAG